MHWYHLPKVIRNADAIREYEHGESKRIGRYVKRFVFIALLMILLFVVWFFLR